jgi:hypothetical protein
MTINFQFAVHKAINEWRQFLAVKVGLCRCRRPPSLCVQLVSNSIANRLPSRCRRLRTGELDSVDEVPAGLPSSSSTGWFIRAIAQARNCQFLGVARFIRFSDRGFYSPLEQLANFR